ncbi:hypothetical protein M378DRAFT_167371 [Amanita muscaria Koide BX008]|uniref:Uncharacterized protein n=1 Tax=Amanita muscaria (strain Koide BX008) TaxID=946122 RepID=A0A0C2T3H4_AMAMK|nr:hypothetical protein M378DRAFT_167371 [Amanita muscaria Koide BX008]
MQSTRALRQNGPAKFGDPNKFKLKEQKNGLVRRISMGVLHRVDSRGCQILGGLAIASVVGVLNLNKAGPVTKDDSSRK